MDYAKELEQVAKEYRAEGYHVIVRPEPGQLPPFAANFGPDLLASGGDDNVLVQVVERRADLASRPDLPRCADVTNSQPGWRFDLVILRGESAVERILHNAAEPTPQQVNLMLDRAEMSVTAGLVEGACVYAWAGLEACMRRARSATGLNGDLAANELITALYVHGIFSREAFDRLREAFRVRTEVVH